MSWIDELDAIVKLLKKTLEESAVSVSGWELFQTASADSYYKDYAASKHFKDNDVMVFDFDTPVEFKDLLGELWEGEESYAPLIRIMTKLMSLSRDTKENMLPEVDVHNYMM